MIRRVLAALSHEALSRHQAADKAGALAWGKAAYVANRRTVHGWLDFLGIVLAAGEIRSFVPPEPDAAPPSASPLIPRTLVQFWDNPAVPADVLEVIETWRRDLGRYSHSLYSKAAARAFLVQHCDPTYVEAYDETPHIAGKADLFRLAWLFHNGGIYVDADERRLADIGFLFPPDAGLVLNWSAGPPPCVNNWFIGARAGHKLLAYQMDLAVQQVAFARTHHRPLSAWTVTGPGVVTMSMLDTVCVPGFEDVLGDIVLHTEKEYRRAMVTEMNLLYKSHPDGNWRLGIARKD